MAMLVLGLGMLAGPPRALAARPIGIDVSDYQSVNINWGTLKNTYGISFAWAKISEGTATGSGAGGGNFTTYAANAKAAGVLIGAYHFARYDLHTGTSGATSEANAFWSAAAPYVTGGGYYMMPMLDLEGIDISGTTYDPDHWGYTKTTFSQWANAWCQTVSNSAAAAGVTIKPVIYTSSSFGSTWLDSTATQWMPWIADWYSNHSTAESQAQGASGPPAGTSPWSTWQVWQYDDENVAQAYTTGDGDIFNGTMAQLVSTMVIGGIPPGITSQPASQTVLAGANVTFTVGVSGATPLSYQWRFNGTNISGASASSYTTNNVQIASAGSYSVVVTNAYGSTNSANAVLTVHAPPVITAQPVNATTGLNMTVTFSVTATGTTPLSYQWQGNGASLSGATNSALTIAGVQATNAGTYAVVVTNLYGTATSSNAVLVVQDPFIFSQPQSQTVGAGAPATFRVGVDGTAPLTYRWSKGGVALADGGNISGSGSATLTLASVEVGDVGTYSVTVSNLNGWVVSSNATLVAPFAPVITTEPVSQQVPAGSPVSLGVTVIGPGPMTYQWQEGGTNLVNGGVFSGAATASLSISNVQAGQIGNYSMVVTNAYGSATSSNALLSVWPLLGWGRDDYSQANIPGGLTNVTGLAAGLYHSLALCSDGTVAAWGAGTSNTGSAPNCGQALVPTGLTSVVAVAGGGYHSLALKADGTVASWGAGTTYSGPPPNFGQAVVPGGLSNAVAVAAGLYHSVALKADGTVIGWGSNQYGQTNSPVGLTNVVAVASGSYHNVALKADGTVVAWGAGTNNGSAPNFGQSVVPVGLTNVVAVAAGLYHSLALKADGTMVAWGSNTYGQTNVPGGLSNVVAVSAGFYFNLALKTDGTVVAWGDSSYGQTNVPAGLINAVKIASGGYHNLVLESDGSPNLTTQPVSQTVPAGATVVYAAMAVGSQPLSYQWQFNGTNIPGATAALLSLPNVQLADAGAYGVTVSNAAGTVASSNALLTVFSPPVISVQPSDQTVIAGAPVIFSVAAAGSAPLGYQWQFNSADITGATQSAYSLASADPTNAGTYSVEVTNIYGTAYSSNAVLTVLVPPSIITQSSNPPVIAEAGANMSFTVQAAGSTPLYYQWYFDQTNLLAGSDTATLYLTNVQPAQAGDYSVVVTNVAGSVTGAVVTLTVLVPPVITTPPAGQTVSAGSPVTFTVGATSSLPLGYQWQFNSAAIAGATQSSYSLLSAQPADAGSYSVVLTNAAGSVTSAVATLIVLLPTPPGILSASVYGADGVFQFNVAGAAGSNYVIEASTNLTDWISLETNTSPFTFTDTNAVNLPLQFYRAQPSP